METVTPQHIDKKLTADLNASLLRATDLSDGCGAKVEVFVVSPEFEGKSQLQRNRAIITSLAEDVKPIHD